MKKIMMAAAVVLLLSNAVAAESGLKFGPKAGIGLAKNSTTAFDNSGPKRITGFLVGQFAQVGLLQNSAFMLQPEIYFVRKGLASSGNITLMLDYFEFPLLVKYRLPVRGKVRPSLLVGPAVSILVNSKYRDAGAPNDFVGDLSMYTDDIEFSLVFGAGVDIVMSKGAVLVFDIRLVTSPATSFSLPNQPQYDGKNSAIMISGGWGFNL